MAITKYKENGIEYYKVYIHVRSKTNRQRRVQKYAYRLKSEVEARKEERKLIREASMEVQKIDGRGLDWQEVVALWCEEVKLGYILKVSERSASGYLSILHKWTSHWNSRPAASLSVADGRELLMRMENAKLSRRYQKKVKNIINNVFDWGVQFRYINGNDRAPMKGLLIDIKEEKVPDILSLEEIKKFLMVAQMTDHYWFPIWAFAILTGMRSGELHALTWKQIDLEKNIIVVDRSYDSNVRKVGPTKARYWRTVPINSSLRKLIGELQMKINDNEHEDYVLPRSKTWDYGDQVVPLKEFLKSIGMKPIKFHALRACFATQMLANGVAAPVVMKIGGWKKSATMDIYLRLAGVDTKGATDCLRFIPEDISFGDNISDLFSSITCS